MKNNSHLKHPQKLKVCSYQEFEPIIYDNGKGFEGDLLRAIAKLWQVPTASYAQSLLVRKSDFDSGKIIDYNSFKNSSLKIGIVPSSAGEKYGLIRAKEAGADPDIFRAYPSEAELLPALLNNEIDAIARGEIGNDYQVAQNSTLLTIAKRDFGEKICFAVDRDNKDFLRELNQALSMVTDEGKLSYKEWAKDHTIFDKRFQDQSTRGK